MSQAERIEFNCHYCKAKVVAKLRVAGLTRQCPGCLGAIVVPIPEPEPYVPPPADPDAIRGLHLLAVKAASLVQIALSVNKNTAMLINAIFVYLPREHELDSVSAQWTHLFDKAWDICEEVNKTIEKYGGQHRHVWIDSLAAMRICDNSRPFSSSQIVRRKWSIATRVSVWNRFGRCCIHCGTQLETWQGHNMHLDHLVPLCEDGVDDESSLVPACPDCNLEKGGKRFPEIEVR